MRRRRQRFRRWRNFWSGWRSGSEGRKMAPEVGLEPTTHRLTADCSTIELLWNPNGRAIYKPISRPSNGFVQRYLKLREFVEIFCGCRAETLESPLSPFVLQNFCLPTLKRLPSIRRWRDS